MCEDGKGVGRGRGRREEGGGVSVCGVGHFEVVERCWSRNTSAAANGEHMGRAGAGYIPVQSQGGRRATTWIVAIVVVS